MRWEFDEEIKLRSTLSMFSLEGKKTVVTGGAGILGSTIARGLAMAGSEVAIGDVVSTEKIVRRLRKDGMKARGYHVDVMNVKSLRICHDEIMKDFGRIDILLNAAGGNIKEATTSENLGFLDISLSALEKVVGLNLFGGAVFPCQVFGKAMAKNENGGSIINISSVNSFRPLTRIPGYCAAKAAVNNFTQWLATNFAQEYNRRLRVNAIAPGFFLTKQNRYLLLDKDDNLTARAKSIISHVPMGEFGKPADLVGLCIWLASDASRFVTGAVIPIDGGFGAYTGV